MDYSRVSVDGVWVVAFRAWMAESGVEPWSRRKAPFPPDRFRWLFEIRPVNALLRAAGGVLTDDLEKLLFDRRSDFEDPQTSPLFYEHDRQQHRRSVPDHAAPGESFSDRCRTVPPFNPARHGRALQLRQRHTVDDLFHSSSRTATSSAVPSLSSSVPSLPRHNFHRYIPKTSG